MTNLFFSMIPLIASLVSLVFAWNLWRQYRVHRRNSPLLWAVSMLLYAIAAFGEFYGLLFGMNVFMYKLYYISAVSLVAVMAAGQVYFMSTKWGHAFLAVTGVGFLAFVLHTTLSPVNVEALSAVGSVVGGEAMPAGLRKIYPPILSGIGGTVLLLGAFWSWWKSRRRSPLLIMVGSLVLMAAGRLAKMGYPEWLPLSELLGITIMYYANRGNYDIMGAGTQVKGAEKQS